jgi:hypothetical protein
MLWFFAIVSIAAAAAVISLLTRQVRSLRRSGASIPADTPSLADILGPKFDRFYFASVRFAHAFLHELSIYSLIAIHQLLLLFKSGFFRLEQRFSRLLNAVKGRKLIHKKGSISVYLMNLKKEK